MEKSKEEIAEDQFNEWEKKIPKELLELLNDFAMNHTYPVRGVLRNLFNEALASGSKDEGEKVLDAIGKLKFEKVFEFTSFQNWLNTAKIKLRKYRRWENDAANSIICLDINGNALTIGEDFMIAEKEELFPVTAYLLIRTSEITRKPIEDGKE